MKVASFFAGCGGLDLGFEQAGYDVIWANEYDSEIHATYQFNHPNTFLCKSDITGYFDATFMARNRVRSWDKTSFTILAQAKNCPLHPQAPPMQLLSCERRMFVPGYEHLYRRLSVR